MIQRKKLLRLHFVDENIFFRNPELIDLKYISILRRFITIQGKIIPRRLTKLNAKQYRLIKNSMRLKIKY